MNPSNDLWRSCVNWLVSIQALPPNHRACRSDAVVFDLAQTLRDGVVLCFTLNILAPGVIDDSRINRRAVQLSEFLCMQNIRTVIYTLQTYFAMSPSELFTAENVYQMTDFAKVLRALSILSNKPQVAARFRPFYEHRRSVCQHRTSFETEEDIYGNLEDLASDHALADEEEELYDSVSDEKEDEGIYGSLIGDTTGKPVTASFKLDKRGHCAHEIFETETNYVSHLEMIIKEFIEPLRSYISPESIQRIFINTETLYPIHKRLLDDLLKMKQNLQAARISEVFIKHKDELVVYGQYCNCLIDAQEHLKHCSDHDERVRLKIEECQDRSRRSKFKLRDLLTVPMQRLLKYHLLVRELQRNTPENHFDHADLGRALAAMQELAQYINEVKRDSEELVKISQIQSRLEGYGSIPLKKYGRVRYDGELKVKVGDERNSSSRNVFLFDQALFMTKLRGDSYILKDLIRLEDMSMDDTPAQKQTKGGKWSFNWRLVSTKSGGPSYVLYSKTDSDKRKWIDAFSESFDNISPQALKGKLHEFAMATFDTPTKCSSCDHLLNGSFYQGYEDSVTKIKCHKSCLTNALKLIESSSVPSNSFRNMTISDAPPVPGRRPMPSSETTSPSFSGNAAPPAGTYKAHREYRGAPSPPFPNAPVIFFQVGQPIEVFQQFSPEWWKGRVLGEDKIGFFPASFVSPHGKPPMEHGGRNWEDFNKPEPCRSSHEQLKNYYWYAGEIDRQQAEQILMDMPTGAFLVRKKSPSGMVVSLKFQNDVKHIKVLQRDNMHFLAECKHFRSVQDLVKFYEINSLSGFFLGLETTLRFPYRDPDMFPQRPMNGGGSMHQTTAWDNRQYQVIGRAIAKFDFVARSPQELSLPAGQFVNIISKAGGDHGWWKGEYNRQVGYFPTSFVDEQY